MVRNRLMNDASGFTRRALVGPAPANDALAAVPELPSLALIDRYQREALTRAGWLATGDQAEPQGLMRWVARNHRCNALLWEQEDLARRTDVADAEIVKNKRAIDCYNQCRNDAIEALDEAILAAVSQVRVRPDAWINSETAGSIIDRLSINSLKLHHMLLQTQRRDVDLPHRSSCAGKAKRLAEQRRHLLRCFQSLIEGMARGHCTYRPYHQFKMYNDPALNPHLQPAARGAQRRRPF